MNSLLARLSLVIFCYLLFITPAFAGTLDDYYLQQFGGSKSSQLQKAVLSETSDIQEPAHCGMPIKKSLRRDWDLLEQSTQKVLAKQLALPVLSGTELTLPSSSGRFMIHYTTSGADAVPSISWVQTVALTFDDVSTAYTSLGWRLAPTISDAPYDIYLRELSSKRLYGQTSTLTDSNGQIIFLPTQGFQYAAPSYMEIDNNFTDSIYAPYQIGRAHV